MSATFENLRILQSAEKVADEIWEQVGRWDEFARDVVGKQLARAADSIGANIAESFGRFHFGEKLQFLYYARGSLFETKYWLNRTSQRQLLPDEQVQAFAAELTGLARQLNSFAAGIKAQRKTGPKPSGEIRELSIPYEIETFISTSNPLFEDDELTWLQTIPEKAR